MLENPRHLLFFGQCPSTIQFYFSSIPQQSMVKTKNFFFVYMYLIFFCRRNFKAFSEQFNFSGGIPFSIFCNYLIRTTSLLVIKQSQLMTPFYNPTWNSITIDTSAGYVDSEGNILPESVSLESRKGMILFDAGNLHLLFN